MEITGIGSKKKIVLLNIIDHFSKFAYSVIVAGKTSAEVVRCLTDVCKRPQDVP